jgi:FYVE zinc finger
MKNNYQFDDESKKLSALNNILPRPEKQWTYSEKCYQCNSAFGVIMNKQHHCRSCGRCVCSACSKMMLIPYSLINCPPEKQTYKETAKSITDFVYKKVTTKEKMVCMNCFIKLTKLKEVHRYINILEYCDLSTIHHVARVSKKYYDSYIYIMFNFWKIQSKDIRKFSRWEINMIRQSCKYFSGHSLWNKQYVKYALIENYSGNNINNIFKDQTKKANCSELLCLSGCSNSVNQEFNIFDLMEIMSFIIHLENISNTKKFWGNGNIKNIFYDFISRVTIDNYEVLITSYPLIIRLLSGWISSMNDEQYEVESNKELINKLLILLTPNSKTLSHLASNTITFYGDNPHGFFANIFKKFVNDSSNYNNEDFKRIKKAKNFFFNELYSVSNYRWEEKEVIDNINKSLPQQYPFNDKYTITKFHNFIDLNGYSTIVQYGLMGNRGVRLEITNGENEKKNVTLILKGGELYEYCNFIILKMILQKYDHKLPINNVCEIRKNVYLVEIEDDITVLSAIYCKHMEIKDHIFVANMDSQLGQIISNYTYSLSLLYCVAHIFKVNIKNHDQIIINKKGEIYFSRFSKDGKISEYNNKILPLTDMIGTKNSPIYRQFITETIQLLKTFKQIKLSLPVIYDIIIKNQLRDQIDNDESIDETIFLV